MFFWLKVAVSALLIAGISELSKRNALFAGVMASLPLVSLLSIIWLYIETKSAERAIALSYSVFWMVIPSLSLFLIFPLLLKRSVPFPWALLASCFLTALIYALASWLYPKFGIKI